MLDRDRHADADSEPRADTAARPDRAPGTPRWVKLLVIACLIVIVLAVIVMVARGGSHGPGMHSSGADAFGGHASPVGSARDFG